MGARGGTLRRRGLGMPRPRLPQLRRPRLPELPSGRVILRRVLVVAMIGIAIACGYMFWLRDSSLVAIERVTVTGVEGRPDVVSSLVGAAEGMTTLHLDQAALEAAVADDPAVLSISAEADFPNGLTIVVDSRQPAAYVDAGDAVVAGDGVVLEAGVDRPDGLPLIEAEAAASGPASGERLAGGGLALARILGGVPEPLRAHATEAHIDEEHGPVVLVGDGIELRFGDPSQSEMKWSAAAAVLADPDLDSAVYIDLAVPSRPVVG